MPEKLAQRTCSEKLDQRTCAQKLAHRNLRKDIARKDSLFRAKKAAILADNRIFGIEMVFVQGVPNFPYGSSF